MRFQDLTVDAQIKAFELYIDNFVIDDDFTFFDFRNISIRDNYIFNSDGSIAIDSKTNYLL